MSKVRELVAYGQAPWLDFIDRDLLTSGRLDRYVDEDGVRGVTSNPSIFDEAISTSDDYEDELRELLASDRHAGCQELFEQLAITDIQEAADRLADVYEVSDGADGFVSFEVSPYLAHDTDGTVVYAKRLWHAIDRPNLMIKVPATDAGIPAITRLLAAGINVNVTLMFSLADYDAVAEAYLAGLERLARSDRAADLARVASVASFFVSRVDGKTDPLLKADGSDEALALKGRIGIANSKLAYRAFRETFNSDRFHVLAEAGARVQRVLWASTSTKDPDYPDTLYVDNLIGPDTVNTMPTETLSAFRERGKVAETITESMDEAERQIESLETLGIDLDDITDRLKREGVKKFAGSYDHLLATLERERRRLLGKRASGRQVLHPGVAIGPIGRRLVSWQDEGFARRLWGHDRSLWGGQPIGTLSEDGRAVGEILDRLGWLNLPDSMRPMLAELESFADEMRDLDIDHVLVLGMGGSSLAPEVFGELFRASAAARLEILDTTHPTAVTAARERIDGERTLVIVSSKSGTTTETRALADIFWNELAFLDDRERHFVAVTDPDTPLAKLARERGFGRLFEAEPDLGGRFSALSPYGMVPAAAAGIDVRELLGCAYDMAMACSEQPATVNEALSLGAALAELHATGRDKLTFFATPGVAAFPTWLEQLIAESTGKSGRGLVPIIGETPTDPASYGSDRVFVVYRLESDCGPADELDRFADALEGAGHPVLSFNLKSPAQVAAEMYRWQVAIAAAATVLGIHPFNQPDVQLAKELASRALASDAGGEAICRFQMARDDGDTVAALKCWVDDADVGDYAAIQAFLAPDSATTDALKRLQSAIRDRSAAATTWSYGPRFLHSTGQLHKGGPERGFFLQVVDLPASDVEVPGESFGLARLIRSQANGDLEALKQRERNVLAIDVVEGTAADALAKLAAALET